MPVKQGGQWRKKVAVEVYLNCQNLPPPDYEGEKRRSVFLQQGTMIHTILLPMSGTRSQPFLSWKWEPAQAGGVSASRGQDFGARPASRSPRSESLHIAQRVIRALLQHR